MNFVIVQFPIIVVSIIYATGIFVSNYYSAINPKLSFFASSFIIFSIVLLEKKIKHRDNLKTIIILFAIFWLSFLLNSFRIHTKENQENKVLQSEFVIKKFFNSNDKYINCIVEDKVNSDSYLAKISIPENSNLKIGSVLLANAEMKVINNLVAPNNFNFKKYLSRKGINNRLEIHKYVEAKRQQKINNKIESKIDGSYLSEKSKGLMRALVLGRKDGIPNKLMDSFSDAGIMHLLALSGLHLGILTIILTFFLKPIKLLKRGTLIRSLIVVMLLWYYSYITGFSSSIIRATIMFSIIVIGNGMRRQVNIYNSLAIAALTLMIIDPNYLFDVGFQLSFSAVIGIVWLFPMLNRLWQPKTKVIKYIWGLLLVSIAAQVATFPITMFYFHKFSGMFLIANLIEIPLITVLLGLSYLIITLLMFGVDNKFIDHIYNQIVSLIEFVSLKISSIDKMVFDGLFIDVLTVILLFIITFLIIIFIERRRVKTLISILLVIIAIQISTLYNFFYTSITKKIMIAKNEIIIQNGHEYLSNKNGGAQLFSNYTIANSLTNNNDSIDDIFLLEKELFLKNIGEINKNPIPESHYLIIDNTTKSPPILITNNNTKAVIFSGYNNSTTKTRWEYFCFRNNILFFNTNEKLFELEQIINYH